MTNWSRRRISSLCVAARILRSRRARLTIHTLALPGPPTKNVMQPRREPPSPTRIEPRVVSTGVATVLLLIVEAADGGDALGRGSVAHAAQM